jgi:hypothetical protein
MDETGPLFFLAFSCLLVGSDTGAAVFMSLPKSKTQIARARYEGKCARRLGAMEGSALRRVRRRKRRIFWEILASATNNQQTAASKNGQAI